MVSVLLEVWKILTWQTLQSSLDCTWTFLDALVRLPLVRFLEDSPELKHTRYSPKPTDLDRLHQNVNKITFWINYEAFRQQVRSDSLGKQLNSG